MLDTVRPLRLLNYTFQVAKLGGEIARDLKNPIEFADSAIAATAIANDLELCTLNAKHFKGIKGVKLFDINAML